jgi:hypothetical protein
MIITDALQNLTGRCTMKNAHDTGYEMREEHADHGDPEFSQFIISSRAATEKCGETVCWIVNIGIESAEFFAHLLSERSGCSVHCFAQEREGKSHFVLKAIGDPAILKAATVQFAPELELLSIRVALIQMFDPERSFDHEMQ